MMVPVLQHTLAAASLQRKAGYARADEAYSKDGKPGFIRVLTIAFGLDNGVLGWAEDVFGPFAKEIQGSSGLLSWWWAVFYNNL